MTLALLLKYWRGALITVLALALIGECAARDRRIGNSAVAKHESRQADSVLRVVTPPLELHGAAIVHDTVKVRVSIARADTIRDTVLLHLTDTLLVKQYIARTDTALHACTELLNDCAAFRIEATAAIAAWKAKANAAPVIAVKSCATSDVLWGAIGVGLGLVAHRR